MKIGTHLRLLICLAAIFAGSRVAYAQTVIGGTVTEKENGKGIAGVELILDPGAFVTETDANGQFSFSDILPGKYQLKTNSPHFEQVVTHIEIGDQPVQIELEVESIIFEFGPVEISDKYSTVAWMRAVDGMSIVAARKNELIIMDRITANLATNNARQVFARVPGLNIWESDGGGLQLGIGGRGLSPNRTSNFNTRQNGYDIAADALGYPESYYTPPTEALQRIEVVRGAASLQYGTQFGGMINFVMRDGPEDKKVEVTSRQTAGSYGLFSTFNSLGGTVGRLNYYTFYQGKRADGWRANSGFRQHTAYGSVKYSFSKRLRLGADYTFMSYLAQQPGGLTDAMFARDPRQSIRDRNWFQVNWNVAAITADVELGPQTRMNVRNFGLYAQRNALGFMGPINRADPGTERNLLTGNYNNFGSEIRLMHKHAVFQKPAALLTGVRYYQGHATSMQGLADAGSGPSFRLLHPEQPEESDFVFPSRNVAAFAEHLCNLSPRISVTPGLRMEYIRTASAGEYTFRNLDLAGNVIGEQVILDNRDRERTVLLAGFGASWKASSTLELYSNISRNYRAINFNDIRVTNPNFVVDEHLRDEKGYNADLGFRGTAGSWLDFDMSLFYLRYKDRIGQVLMTDPATFRNYRLRTNISDSRNLGIEWYAEADVFRLFQAEKPKTRLSVFSNFAWINARYIDSKVSAFDGKKVELVPPVTFKGGINLRHASFRGNVQWAYVAGQFSDATNAMSSASAVEGWIPAYDVLDLSLAWTHKFLTLEGGSNNLLNRMYFSRRASGYPGPGIIPSEARSFYLTVQARF